jgi:PhnB protein
VLGYASRIRRDRSIIDPVAEIYNDGADLDVHAVRRTTIMGVTLNPYLSFRDNAKEAMEFYHSVFGGELTRSTFGEFHASEDPSEQEKTMHAALTTPTGLTLMAADTPNAMEYTPGNNFSVSLSGASEDADELRGYWDKLTGGGSVTMPLEAAPWGDSFGMCVDKFGVAWMVNIAGAPAGATASAPTGTASSDTI